LIGKVWCRGAVTGVSSRLSYGRVCQRVKGVHVGTSSWCRVRESSLCPSACPCEEKLKLKRVTVEVCTVFRELCPCPRGASWLRPA
jgi:hypothetical protein